MMSIKIEPEIRIGKQLYRQYYWRQFMTQLRSLFMLFALLAAVVVIGLGLYFENLYLRYTGQFILAIYLFYLGIYAAQQLYYCQLRIRSIFGNKTSETPYTFGFDHKGLYYAAIDSPEKQIPWDYFGYYQLYPKEIYLFNQKKGLVDIISAKIIGGQEFEKFKALVVEAELAPL